MQHAVGLITVEDGPGGSVYAEYTDKKVWVLTIPCRCGETMTLSFRNVYAVEGLQLVVDHRGDEVSMHCDVGQVNMSWVMVGMQGTMDFIGSAGGPRCGYPWFGKVEAWLLGA